MSVLLSHACCLTLEAKADSPKLGLLRDAAVLMEGERIAWLGPSAQVPNHLHIDQHIDVGGALVTPGLIDCHTHLTFAGSRPDEFFLRLQGVSYEHIQAQGGGIYRTVDDTQQAESSELVVSTQRRLQTFLNFGVTTVEIKSGYGLSVSEELRLLKVISQLKHVIDVVPTLLAAHVPPRTGLRQNYIDEVVEHMLPLVKAQDLAHCCDVFCDAHAFTVAETRKILQKAKSLGLSCKLHADQLADIGAAQLAAELGALSADHLDYSNMTGIQAMASAGVVGVLLPGALFSMGKRHYPPAREFLQQGLTLALSTDCNPGSSYSENLPLMMTLAAIEMKLPAEDIWPMVTCHAAKALGLGDRGTLAMGQLADVVIWDAQDPADIIYHYASVRPTQVIKRGTSVL